MKLGAWVGDKFRLRNAKRRRIVEVNLALCFPALSESEREQLCIKHFQAYGRSLVDMGLSLWGSEKRLLALVDTQGYEDHLHLLAKKNVLLVTWHMTALEVCGNIVSRAAPSISMMKSMNNPLLTWQFARGRRHFNDVQLVLRAQGLKPIIKGIRGGRQGLLIPDEDFGDSSGKTLFVPFFAVQRSILLTPVRVAKSADAEVVICGARLVAETGKYVCTFSPPIEPEARRDPEEFTRAIASSMEQLIRQSPEQYMWTFRWFQTRPDGAESPYDVVPPR